MSASRFDPSVVALLAEIARDPEARMLRIPEKPLRSWTGQGDVLTPHGSFLTRAERHLVQSYREEAARILVEACVLRLREEPLFFSDIPTDSKAIATGAKRISERVEDQQEVLRQVGNGDAVSPTVLAAASLRLAPSETAFNALAFGHAQEGHLRPALRVLDRFLDGRSSAFERATAFENRGKVLVLKQDFSGALRSDQAAVAIDEHRVRFAVCCLTDSVQLGSASEIQHWSKVVDEHPDQASVATFAQHLKKTREAGEWSPTKGSRGAIRLARPQLKEGSGAICDAFA
jgi:hypothetical protein